MQLRALATICLIAVAGCAGSGVSDRAADLAPVDGWARTIELGEPELNWITELEATPIPALVREALSTNFQLAEQRIRLEEARQAVVIAGADRLPSLTASVDATRRGADSPATGSQTDPTDYGLTGVAAWELDLWLGLTDAARAARLDYESELAAYEAARRSLVADTAALGFEAISARQLLTLFEQRLESLQVTYDIIDGSYRRGLGNALDVYLAQNALEQQREIVAQQRQTVLETTASLQLTLGRYPDGDMALPESLPVITGTIPPGMPSGLLARRQDIRAAWLGLLAADARFAVAHKNRFPRLVLTGAGGSASGGLSDLLSADVTSWTVAGTLTQPIFAGGRLRAAERQARARIEALEHRYLGLVYQAFADVENALSRSASLSERYTALEKAERNARAALVLSFDQYQRGLVSFTTVLEAQRRAFDSGTALVRIQNALMQNRVTLYRSLGGEFILDD